MLHKRRLPMMRGMVLALLIAAGATACRKKDTTISTFAGSGQVCVTKSGNCFHRPTCKTIKGHDYDVVSREEAERRGRKPCKVCKP